MGTWPNTTRAKDNQSWATTALPQGGEGVAARLGAVLLSALLACACASSVYPCPCPRSRSRVSVPVPRSPSSILRSSRTFASASYTLSALPQSPSQSPVLVPRFPFTRSTSPFASRFVFCAFGVPRSVVYPVRPCFRSPLLVSSLPCSLISPFFIPVLPRATCMWYSSPPVRVFASSSFLVADALT